MIRAPVSRRASRHEGGGPGRALASRSATERSPRPAAAGPERAAGNQAIARLFATGAIQAKLEVNHPGDRWEQEADRVADQVVAASPPRVQRRCRECEEEETLQAKELPGRVPQAAEAGAGSRVLRGGGSPLPAPTRSFFESRFGRDFGDVRIHRGARAAGAAASLDARAFTVGRDIAFGAGEFAPETRRGRHLLAHELTHVVQQGSAARSPVGGSPPAVQRFTAAECTASGCAPATRCDTVQADFERAERYVRRAIDALDATPVTSFTQQAIRWYFHRDGDTAGRDVRRRLDLIETVLLLTDISADFLCAPEADCGDTIAFVRTGTPVDTPDYTTIHLCESYFDKGARGRAETLIHEAAHLVGMSVSTDDVYDHTFRFRGLSTSQAILNSDSYALFASAIGTGSIGLSAVLSFGLEGGVVAGGPAGVGWFASYYLDTTFQHPVLHVFNPTLRLSATAFGVPGSGTTPLVNEAFLVGVLPGFRIEQPRPSGGTPSLSIFGGPSFSFRDGGSAVGAQAGLGIGYRWSFLDLSAGATYVHDPTAVAPARHLVQIGGSLSVIFPAINP